jgi:hypothetical protein
MAGFRFSRRTILSAIGVLDQLTQAKLTRFLLELGPDYSSLVGGESISVSRRLNNLMELLDQEPDRLLEGGNPLRDIIIEKAAKLLPPAESDVLWRDPLPLGPAQEGFLRALHLDGYVVTDNALRPALPADLELPAAEDETTRLLKKHGLSTPEGHLTQALDALGRGKWASANAQLRTFFDALLDKIAVKLDGSAASLPSGQARRSKLASLGFLSRDLNEWHDNGLGFINGLVKRLHPQGAHPGLSDEKDSVFRLHIVLLAARQILFRFDTWGKP